MRKKRWIVLPTDWAMFFPASSYDSLGTTVKSMVRITESKGDADLYANELRDTYRMDFSIFEEKTIFECNIKELKYYNKKWNDSGEYIP